MEGSLASLLSIAPTILNELSVDSYDKFIFIIYEELDYIIADLTDNPELSFGDSEDRTTIDIVRSLKSALRKRIFFNVSHDTKIGGHADIIITYNKYRWIAEAKIYKGSYAWIYKGLLQLITRYSKGDDNNKEGALIIYIKKENTKNIMTAWREKLQNKTICNKPYEFYECNKSKQAFYSIQEHPRSGECFKVRHIPVSLNFNPLDVSQ